MTAEHRPGYHFTPARNWMNDPNGLIWHGGEYHLFFQYNPEGSDWGNMSWGHATSPDLVQWRELPVAIRADEEEHVFSGCAVLDRSNTSGLGSADVPPLLAFYTSQHLATETQRQSIASSVDGGDTWSRYPGNPVIDIGASDFRDPKVFWSHDAGAWVMVLALPNERIVRFYTSPDLLHWEQASEFGPAGSTAGIWECPDLVLLGIEDDPDVTRWVLIVSVQGDGPAGGSATQYFVGDFDGYKFTADRPDETCWVDHGADYYAAVSFADDPQGRSIHIGWMSNWNYSDVVPTSPFRGVMSLPRSYQLRRRDGRDVLVQRPITPAWSDPVYVEYDAELVDTIALPRTALGTRLRIKAILDPGTAERVGLRVRAGASEGTGIWHEAGPAELVVDRSRSGETHFHPSFGAAHRAPYVLRDGLVELEIYLDTCTVEVFAGDGEVAVTDLIFPAPTSVGVELFAEGGVGRIVSLEVSHPVRL